MVEGLSSQGKELKRGIYRHYKGALYEVLGVGHHTETEEEVVMYRSLSGRHALWARPLTMFLENSVVDGDAVPRFEYLGELGCVPELSTINR